MKGFIEDFKTFAVKGNVIDLAIAVVIGTAFGKIISSLVDTIIMPLFGILLGNINFSELTHEVGKVVVSYGQFIQAVIDFLIIAFVIFVVIRMIGKMDKKEEEKPKEPKEPKEPSEEILLLREIRDAVKR